MPTGLTAYSHLADFGPNGLTFNVPVTLTLPTAAVQTDQSRLIHEYFGRYAVAPTLDPETENTGQSLDASSSRVSYDTTHLSIRRVVGNTDVDALIRRARQANATEDDSTYVDGTVDFSRTDHSCNCPDRTAINGIVVHSTDSGTKEQFADTIVDAIKKKDFAQYYIDRDGTTILVAPDTVTVPHTGGPSGSSVYYRSSIGIEMYAPRRAEPGDTQYSDYTQAQIQKLTKIINALARKYPIDVSHSACGFGTAPVGVVRHTDCSNGVASHNRQHADPFGWDDAIWAAYKARLQTGSCTSAPNAPTGLTRAVSGSTIQLSWSTPSSGQPVSSYAVQVGSSSGASNIATASTTGTSYTTSTLANATYYARVFAVNSCGTSAASNEVSATIATCTGAPNAPIGLSGVASGSTIALSWSAPSGGQTTTGYVVEIGSSSGAKDITQTNTGSTATTFTSSTLANGTYYIRVRARNSCGTSSASNEVVVTIGGPTTYSGPFSGTFTESQSVNPFCVFTFTYTGQQVMTLTVRSDSTVTGSVHITGTQSTPNSSNCTGGTFQVDRTDTVTGTTSNMQWGHTTWTITGSLSGTTVSGRMTTSGTVGSSTYSGTIPFTLTKQ